MAVKSCGWFGTAHLAEVSSFPVVVGGFYGQFSSCLSMSLHKSNLRIEMKLSSKTIKHEAKGVSYPNHPVSI